MVPRIPTLAGNAMRRHIVASPSDAGSAGRLGWGSREIARRAGVESRGRPTPAGRAEQLVSAAAILAVPNAGVFSKWQFAFEFARRRPQRRSENMSSQQGNAVKHLAPGLGHRDYAVTTRRDRAFIRGRIVREVDGVVAKTAGYMPKADLSLVVVFVPAKPLVRGNLEVVDHDDCVLPLFKDQEFIPKGKIVVPVRIEVHEIQ